MTSLHPIVEPLNPTPENISRFKKIYFESFPKEERRPWEQVRSFLDGANQLFKAFAITDLSGILAGFITVWHLPGMNYIEHFAVESGMRGNGTGKNALKALMDIMPGNYVLEVEPQESGETARRRIGFYSRLGFSLREEFDYIQPPYSDSLPPVPLTLMTTGDVDPENAKNLLWDIVYCKKSDN